MKNVHIKNKEVNLKQFIVVLGVFLFFSASNGYCQRLITVDFQHEIGHIKDLMGVNRGPDNKVLGYKDAGVTAVRPHDDRTSDYYNYADFWNFDPITKSFTTINENFDPSNPAHYHWEQLDTTINAIVANVMEVFFRIGISWPDNSAFPRPPLTPPFDANGRTFTNFSEMCRRTVMHYNHGWHNGFNRHIQYWEIWNEPDGSFWKGTPQQYYQMYAAAATAIKNYDPSLKVGGPGAVPVTIVKPKPEYFRKFLQYVKENKIPLDFYSWHLYGAKNPYGVKYFAQLVRQELDNLGLTTTESYISEINYELNEAQKLLDDNATGATYLLSNLLTLQDSPVDKMFWYPGLGLFHNDFQNQPQFKCNAYGLKTYSLIYKQTPIQIEATGSDVVEGNWQADTTNFMVLAAKSADNQKVYLVISNFRSNYKNYEIQLKNLPWSAADKIKLTQNIVADPADRFTETTAYSVGANTIQLTVNNMPSPSILLIGLEKEASTGLKVTSNSPDGFQIKQNYPNPFNPVTIIPMTLQRREYVSMKIFDLKGREIATLINGELSSGEHTVVFNAANLPSGVYIYRLNVGQMVLQRKMEVIK